MEHKYSRRVLSGDYSSLEGLLRFSEVRQAHLSEWVRADAVGKLKEESGRVGGQFLLD